MRFLLIALFLSQLVHSQEIIFVNEDNKLIPPKEVKIQFKYPDTIMAYQKRLNLSFVKDSNQIIKLIHPHFEPVLLPFFDFIQIDTVHFRPKTKSIKEIIITSQAIRRESNDSLHIVDFHFIDGHLFTLRKSIYDIRVKYLCKNDSCIKVNNRTILIQNKLNNQQVVEIKDSIYLFDGKQLAYIENRKEYRQKFANYIGSFNNKYYYEENPFYQLIKEYSYFDTKKEKLNAFYTTSDSASFYFISQQYRKIPLSQSDPYLIYRNGSRSGQIFKNIESIQISKPTTETSYVF